MSLSNFFFLRPYWLLLVPIVLGLWWLVRQSRDPLRGWRSLMDKELLRATTVGESERTHWRDLGLFAVWILTTIAIAGPTWRPEPSPFSDDPVPVMVLLKAGETMNLSDIQPSRLERAHLKIADLAKARGGKPLGLIAYAGTAHLVLPPTRDTDVVATMAAEISPEIMPEPGDDLEAALQLAQSTLGEAGGSVALIADNAVAISPEQRIAFPNLSIDVLGIARPDTPEAEALTSFASSVRGRYVPMTPDSTDIDQLVQRLAKQPRAVASEDGETRWQEAGWWLTPMIAMLVLLSFRRTSQAPAMEVA